MEETGSAGPESEKKSLKAAEQIRPEIAQARQDWVAQQPNLDADHLVFIDETWASTAMTPTRGRAPKGHRCIGYAPSGHWHTTTFVCALCTRGLVAPLVLDGPINGETFREWVRQFLVKDLQPGDVVVMDNLGSHKVAGIREAIEAVGATLRYLPPYSPDYNPIEQVFAKLKTWLRKTAARTMEALWDACGTLLDRFSANECWQYIRHAGYRRSG